MIDKGKILTKPMDGPTPSHYLETLGGTERGPGHGDVGARAVSVRSACGERERRLISASASDGPDSDGPGKVPQYR